MGYHMNHGLFSGDSRHEPGEDCELGRISDSRFARPAKREISGWILVVLPGVVALALLVLDPWLISRALSGHSVSGCAGWERENCAPMVGNYERVMRFIRSNTE